MRSSKCGRKLYPYSFLCTGLKEQARKMGLLRGCNFKVKKKGKSMRKGACEFIRRLRQKFGKTKALLLQLSTAGFQNLIQQLAHTSFSFVQRACSLAYIIPFRRNSTTGRLEMLPRRSLTLHYVFLVIFGLNLVHKTAAVVQQATIHELLGLETMFCMG